MWQLDEAHAAHRGRERDGSARDGSVPGESAPGESDESGARQSSARGRGAASQRSGALGGLRSWMGTTVAAAQAERDVARVKLKMTRGASWCTAAI